MSVHANTTGLDVDGITQRLLNAVATSERATLSIGKLLDRFVELATSEGSDGATSRDDGGLGVASNIAAVMSAAGGFTNDTRAFLSRQLEFAKAANDACRCIYRCADSVADLMRKSHLLALNMKIESSRTKVQNSAFSVIGQEMAQFSHEVRGANDRIVEALNQLSDSLPQLESEAIGMDQRAMTFSEKLKVQLSQAQDQVADLREARNEADRLTVEKNQKILELSHMTLSELSFQDPMAQDLLRMTAELAMFESGHTSSETGENQAWIDTPLDESEFVESNAAGEVMLF